MAGRMLLLSRFREEQPDGFRPDHDGDSARLRLIFLRALFHVDSRLAGGREKPAADVRRKYARQVVLPSRQSV